MDNVFHFKYDLVTNFRNGLAWVKKKDKWGAVDKNGNIRCDFIYDAVKLYNGNKQYSIVGKNKYFGAIDNVTGNTILDFIYTDIKVIDENYFSVSNDQYNYDKYYYLIDKDRNNIIRSKYHTRDFYKLTDDIIMTSVPTEDFLVHPFAYFYYSLTKQEFLDIPSEVCILHFEEGFSTCFGAPNAKYCYIDKNLNRITDFIFEDAYDFHNGYAICKIYNKYGVIDNYANIIIPFKYDYLSTYDGIWYSYKKKNLFQSEKKLPQGVMDINRQVRIKPKYKYVSPFKVKSNITVAANLYGHKGIINKKDEQIICPSHQYKNLDINENIIIASYNNSSYNNYFDEFGDLKIRNIKNGSVFIDGFAQAEDENGKFGFINTNGEQAF